MAPRYAMELIDRTLRDFMNVDMPFGGKTMLLGGDFRQLLPVKVNATRSELVNLSMKSSTLWSHFKVISLTENMRILPGEIEFSEYLLSVGNGTLNDNDNNILAPEQCVENGDIIHKIFGELIINKKYDAL
ncbi:uncharacterized protein LOC122504401 [Leptopilina heterotoma]|uniref:uncharacterized protein LOC122504401 n=1 Tax=Leptopilina heterotoma TaxID=63436 RepID=UPI001CA8091D|nr:uncharacterized protein LOC122504401 [Leptopilina heterotoma]